MRTLLDLERPAETPSALTPRPYQVECVDAFYREIRDRDSTLIGLPTGCGKTVVFGLAADRWLKERAGDVLVLAHREELIFQARDELAGILGFEPDVEMAEYRASTTARAVVASVQSLWQENRLKEFSPSRFGLVVIDEAHHATRRNRTYWNILNHFSGAKRLGVTATLTRGDGVMLGESFGSVCYHMGIREAVEGGWLVPVRQQFVTVSDLNLSAVGTVAGELNQSQLAGVLRLPDVVKRTAAAAVEHCGAEPTLVFTVDVDQAEDVAAVLNAIKPQSAVALSGRTPSDDRRRHLQRYAAGEFQFLVGCALFTEGFNEPRISRVVMARPTKSIVYYTQAVGRGTRTLRGVLTPDLDTAERRRAAIAASGKPDLLVLDFVGNSGRHKLVSCVDIFAGKPGTAVAERARKTAEKAGRPVDVVSALTAADGELKAAERRQADRAAAARVRAEVRTHAVDVDPFGGSDSPAAAGAKRDRAAPATAGQLDYIRKGGGFVRANMTVAEAGKEVADVNRRRREGLCSRKQEWTLKKYGFGPLPKLHAKAVIDLIAARGWYRLGYELTRDRLSIRRVEGGYRLAVDDPSAGVVPVGATFASPGDVRAAYRGLCPEPAAV